MLTEHPGFTPEQLDQFREMDPAQDLDLPNHTGHELADDPVGNIISTSIPEEAGPDIGEAGRGESYTTPGGAVVAPHGGKSGGLECIEEEKGHTVGQIDEIIAKLNPELSGCQAGKGLLKGKGSKF